MRYYNIYFVCALISIILLMSSSSQAQKWVNLTDGRHVNDIEEEGDYLWIATAGGVVKFNTTTYNKSFYNEVNSPLASSGVDGIAIDQSGNKWFATSEGLSKFDGSSWTTYTGSNSDMISSNLYDVAVDDSGHIWLGSPAGAMEFDGTNWTDYYNYSDIFVTTVDGEGKVWLGTRYSGVYVYDTSWTQYDASLPDSYINAIEYDSDNNVWVGTNDGVAKYDGSSWSSWTYSNSDLPDYEVLSISFDDSNNKWFATNDKGAVKFDGNSNWTIYEQTNSSISDNNVAAVYVSNDNKKWIGAKDSLNIYENSSWSSTYISNSGLLMQAVSDIGVGTNSTAWIGSQEGLIKLKKGKYTSKVNDTFGFGWPYLEIENVIVDNNNIPWISTYYLHSGTDLQGSIEKFKNNNWEGTCFKADAADDLAIDNKGQVVAATVFDESPYYNNKYYIQTSTAQGCFTHDSSQSAMDITVDSKNHIWVADGDEALIIKGDTVINSVVYDSLYTSGLPASGAHAVAYDKTNQKIWLAINDGNTYAELGLATYDGSEWKVYTDTSSQLPTDEIKSITYDPAGYMWFTSMDSGVIRFDGSNWKTFKESNSKMPSNDVNAITIDADGNKWFATQFDGVVIYNSSGVDFNFGNTVGTQFNTATVSEKVNVYPNPFKKTINFKYRVNQPGDVAISIYDLQGREVKRIKRGKHSVGEYRYRLNLSLSPGMYIYKLKVGQQSHTGKLMRTP